jgi:predicted nucleic acid-binding protein
MTERWVLNASPLICLSRAGFHHLLISLPEQVILPEAVASEVNAGPEGDPARRVLAHGELRVVPVPALPEVLAWDLGAGETAVLSFAISNPDWHAIIDDRAARKCARTLGIAHKGTLAVVLMAKKQGLVESAAVVLRSIQSAGLQLDDHLVRQALKEFVDENW